MRSAAYRIDETEILDKVFTFLVKRGLESISIRKLCKGTGIVQGSLYYWFNDKNSVISECTEYGLKKVTDKIFDYVFANINNLPFFFANCLDEIDKYRAELRFIYQMSASPIYGEKIRKDGKYFKDMYDKYADRLAKILNCEYEKLKPVVYLFISAVCDYAIWEDRQNAQAEIDFIYSILPVVAGTAKEVDENGK